MSPVGGTHNPDGRWDNSGWYKISIRNSIMHNMVPVALSPASAPQIKYELYSKEVLFSQQ